MKQSKRMLLALTVLVCLLTGLVSMSGSADNRIYTVHFFAGNIGVIAGDATYTGTGSSDDSVSLPGIQIKDRYKDGYYPKGFIESGRDPRNFYILGGSMPVTRDQDYMAVYGIKGTEVRYTVQYLLSGTTTKLAEDGVYYAAVGDKPISSYIYIDGYQPSRRTTKTLVSDESQNILYCYYTRIEQTGGGTGAAVADGTGAAVAGGGGAAAGGGNAPGANPAADANPADATGPADANAAGGGTDATAAGSGTAAASSAAANANPFPTQQYAQTEDILDLDVPLAAPDMPGAAGSQNTSTLTAPAAIEPQSFSKVPTWMLTAGIVLLILLIGTLYWYLLFYRKKKKYASYETFDIMDDVDDDDDF